MNYYSTRDTSIKVTASEAIVKGISVDGGLFIPSSFPTITREELITLSPMSYPERSAYIIGKYLTDFTYEELLDCTTKAYAKFDTDYACPTIKLDEGNYILELWHGPTSAFKDMALALLPYLMTLARQKVGLKEKSLILVATSGDTGKAALEGFADVEGTEIVVFYPNEGVSMMQQLQMNTQVGKNVHIASINGNFDDAQTAVKEIFTSKDMEEKLLSKGYKLSSANSINWGRLVPQIAYYISAYVDMVDSEEIKLGDKINFAVPSGNFGNILAGYYAKCMGMPFDKLICASNQNNVLTDFLETGVYDIKREFYKSMSPSMDILISSNLERLLFLMEGSDSDKVKSIMKSLQDKGEYKVDINNFITAGFVGGYATEEDTYCTIDNFFEEYDYPLDPHTAIAVGVYYDYVASTNDETNTIIVSTASPYKFTQDVLEAIIDKRVEDVFKAAAKLYSISAMDIPANIKELKNKKILHNTVIDKRDIAQTVLDFLIR